MEDSLNRKLTDDELHQMGKKVMLEIRRASEKDAYELLAAGWMFEPVTEDSEPWQWYWRAPPKRKGSKGRLYKSTSQAINALRRESK